MDLERRNEIVQELISVLFDKAKTNNGVARIKTEETLDATLHFFAYVAVLASDKPLSPTEIRRMSERAVKTIKQIIRIYEQQKQEHGAGVRIVHVYDGDKS